MTTIWKAKDEVVLLRHGDGQAAVTVLICSMYHVVDGHGGSETEGLKTTECSVWIRRYTCLDSASAVVD